MSVQKLKQDKNNYTVRWYEPGDEEGICSVLATEWEPRPTTEWFDWKYSADPYLSHVPVNVAERDGRIVGVQAYLPCRVRWRGRTMLALKPVDAMVHPDHRKRGLYTRLTRAAIDYYTDREPAFFFNFPNAASLGAQEKLGWSAVDVVATAYRIQRPATVLPSASSDALDRLLAGVADASAGAYLGVRDRLRRTADGFDVTRHDDPPAETLESLYESHVPEQLHVHREAAFYRWFFDNPACDHTTYVAERNGRPVAAATTRTRDGKMVKLMDALPIGGERAATVALLDAVLADNTDAAVLTVAEETLPRDLLASFGFVSYDNPVLSRVGTPTYMAARPLWPDDESGPVPRDALTADEMWRITLTESKD